MRNFLLNDTCYERLIYATFGLILALFCLADPLQQLLLLLCISLLPPFLRKFLIS